jgi:hypothetical protein
VKLFIDDIRMPYNDEWQIVRNGEEAIALLSEYHYDAISFDNDLGPAPALEGVDVLRFLEEEWCLHDRRKPSEIRVHTANTVARDYMRRLLIANGYKATDFVSFNIRDQAWIFKL